jgi:hypothetical protein
VASVRRRGRRQQANTAVANPAPCGYELRRRVNRVVGIDIESCPGCDGKLANIASIEEPELIAKILAYLAHTSQDHYQPELPLGARAPSQQSRLI